MRNLQKKIGKTISRCRCPNNTLFIIALLSLILFLTVEIVIRSYNLYKSVPLVDVPSHFFAGIALTLWIYWILSLTNIKRKKQITLLLTIVSAGIWELLETLEELIVPNLIYLKDIFFWDGFWDIIVTFIGGIFIMGILFLFKTNINIDEVLRPK